MGAPSGQRARLAALLEPVVAQAGYDLEDLSVSPAGRRSLLRVVVDAEGGVSLDDIAEVSRAVSGALDEADDFLGRSPYTLEVTSPGVDRPLTLPRHWARNTGRLVKVVVAEDALTARILAAGETGVTLEVDGAAREVAYGDLGPGKVQVEFVRPGAAPVADDDGGES